jgi:hypothetical protein
MKFMDREVLAQRLNSLSDEELLKLVGPLEEHPKDRPFVELPDGSRVEADSAEELNRLLVAKLGEYREREEPAPAPVPQNEPKPRKWDYKKFQETFVNDPRAGQEYLEEVQSGIPGGYSKMVPMLINALGALTSQVQELQTQDFLNQTPEYDPSPENRKVLDKIISDRGWKVSNASLADAFDIAKSRGMIKGKEGRPERSNENVIPMREPAFIPPRVKRGMGTEEEPATTAEIINRAYDMDIKDLQKLLIAAGALKSEHI